MTRKIHDDAFAYYVSLQEDRSYQLVAEHYGCSKRAVVKAASRDNWSGRLAEIERDARERMDKKLADAMVEREERHIKLARAIQARAARAIAGNELKSAMEGIKAAEIGVKLERMVAGQPNDRTAVTVEQVTKQEMERLLAPKDEPADAEKDDDDDAEEDW